MAEERAQRRLAADVVGYSRLMERDEVGTFAALKKGRNKVLEPLTAAYRTNALMLSKKHAGLSPQNRRK